MTPSVWKTRSLNSVNNVSSAQNNCTRAANNQYHRYKYEYEKDMNIAPSQSHTKGIFNKLGILALPNVIAECILCLMH